MLKANDEGSVAVAGARLQLSKALRLEWLGQTAASLFWIISCFTYGLEAPGDWLQLLAASAWMVANLASLSADEPS